MESDGTYNPFVPVRIPVREGSKAHREWERVWETRKKNGVEVPTHNRDGYPAPVVVVLSTEEWEAEVSRKRMRAL